MVLVSRRQAEVLNELEEWREDVRERGIGSRVVLLVASAGWGRSVVLARFRAAVDEADGPVTVVAQNPVLVTGTAQIPGMAGAARVRE